MKFEKVFAATFFGGMLLSVIVGAISHEHGQACLGLLFVVLCVLALYDVLRS